MKDIIEIADRENLAIIEDGCHALGAEIGSEQSPKKIGNPLREKLHAVVFSFHPVKNIATGEGGAICTNDRNLAKQIELIRSHGITKNPDDFQQKELAYAEEATANIWYQEMQYLGYNYRMTDIQAALGLSQIERISEFISKRRNLIKRYRKELMGLAHIKLPPADSAESRSAWHIFPVQIDFSAIKIKRHDFMKALLTKKIGTQVHYLPVYWHHYYRKNRNLWLSDSCQATEEFYEKELSIPVFFDMTQEEQDRVISAISELLSQ